MDRLQRDSFDYFLYEASAANGLVIDKTAPDWPASIAATGLALAAYPVGVARGYISRTAAVERTLATLRFFWRSPHGPEPDATGYQGFYYHFLDMQTGRRAWQCELSTVDSAFLLAGALTTRLYFDADTSGEREIRSLADALYCRADWQWAQNGGATVTHGWTPEGGFLRYRWKGYDEALLLYVLGLGSPTHPLPETSYAAWCSTYEWKRIYGQEYLYAGPLFTHQLSHIWIDFRGIQDAFMRDKGIDYFENSRRATYVQQRYAIDNPLKFEAYGRDCWGITASEGSGSPDHARQRRRATVFRLRGARRPVRTGRRHHRPVGRGGVITVCARNCVARARLLSPRGQPDGIESVRIQGVLQSDLPGEIRQSPRVGIAMAFRAQPRADHSDDRKSSDGLTVAVDATVPVSRQWLAAGGVCRRLALRSQVSDARGSAVQGHAQQALRDPRIAPGAHRGTRGRHAGDSGPEVAECVSHAGRAGEGGA